MLKGYVPQGGYAYVNTRARVKIAKLIPPGEYNKLLQMDLKEIAKYLEETEYRKEIDELAIKYSNAKLITLATKTNMFRTFNQLFGLSPIRFRNLFAQYLKKWEIQNLKSILRGKVAGAKKEEIIDLLVPVGSLSEDFLKSLSEKKDVADVVESLNGTEYYALLKGLVSKPAPKLLLEMETALDRHYLQSTARVLEAAREGKVFRNFVKSRVDVKNLKLLLKLRNEDMKADFIYPYLMSGGKIPVERLRKMAKLPMEELLKELEKTAYWKYISGAISQYKETRSLGGIDPAFGKFTFSQAIRLLHRHPLTIVPLFTYVVVKEAEVRNLRTIAHCKAAGIQPEAIKSYLVL